MVTVRCGGSPAVLGQSWAARASPHTSSRASALRCGVDRRSGMPAVGRGPASCSINDRNAAPCSGSRNPSRPRRPSRRLRNRSSPAAGSGSWSSRGSGPSGSRCATMCRPIVCSDVGLNDRAWWASSASAASRSVALTLAGIAAIVSAITRTCPGPISPAASAAAVVGNNGASTSPPSARRGASCPACATRAPASVDDRFSIPASSCFVLRNPTVTAISRASSSATVSSITEYSIRDADSMSRT